MSIPSIIQPKYSSNSEDHTPIIRQKTTNLYRHDGGEEWSVGCICGYYYGGSTGWFIPAKVSAERLYKAHLIEAGIQPPDEIQSDADEAVDPVDMREVEFIIARQLTLLLEELCNNLIDKKTAFTTIKGVLFKLEQECQD